VNIRKIKENSFIKSIVRNNPLLKKLIRPYTPSYYKGKNIHAYSLADYFGEKFGCTHIIDIGCKSIENFIPLHPKFKIIGYADSQNLLQYSRKLKFVDWKQLEFEKNDSIPLSIDILKKSVIVCDNFYESLENPTNLLDTLKKFLDNSPICILTTTNQRTIESQSEDTIKENQDIKKTNFEEFKKILLSKGFNLLFVGLTVKDNTNSEKNNIIAIIEGNDTISNQIVRKEIKAPEKFKVISIMAVFNEADIIIPSIKYLVNQGIDVYVIDNWSTDGTYELIKNFEGKGLVGIERFPSSGPSSHFIIQDILSRDEKLTQELDADWFIHQDCDEIRASPWPDVNLKDAIYMADKSGFNAIDHTIIEFRPLDNEFKSGSNFENHFHYYEFSKEFAHFFQVKAWKNLAIPISLADSGGHQVTFKGIRVYPFKFLLKHYPIRSQSHGEKKVFKERKTRWYKPEQSKGWHAHYDVISEGHNFLYQREKLEFFEEEFYKKFLVERISGIGIN